MFIFEKKCIYLSTGFPSLSTNPDFNPNLSLKGLSQS